MTENVSSLSTRLEGRRILFVGLGQIGVHLATHLHTDGAEVVVFNRNVAKAAAWADTTGGAYTTDPLAVLPGCDTVISCVGNDADLADVFSSDFIRALPANALVIDHTTASARGARALAGSVATANARFVDAPVSGGSAGAANRKLSIMVGADDVDTFTAAEHIMMSYAARVLRIGTVGAGQLCKMANQLCIAGALEGVAEAIGLALRAGLDPAKVVDALSGGAAKSWQLENRSSFMIEQRYPAGFAARLMLKDLGLALAEAQQLNLDTPVADVVHGRYKSLVSSGLGDEDFSNIFRLVIDKM